MRSAATVLLLLVLAAGGATPRMPPGDEAADEVGLGDDCDWFGSGLSGPERGVSPVYLRCSQGRVRWSYPRGALRVLLRAGGAGKEFRGCVRLGPHAQGARIFLESPRSLAPLFRDDEEEDNSVLDQEVERGAPVCFRSRGGVAVLFVDAAGAATPLAPHAVEFFYHLHPDAADAPSLDHADDECRPCTPEEMLHLYCTCDYVARGTIAAVRPAPGQRSAVHVLAGVVLRRSAAFDAAAAGEAPGRATLLLPSRCGAAHGPGEFLFLGRVRMGQAELVCAPQLKEWALARADALAGGRAKCSLEW